MFLPNFTQQEDTAGEKEGMEAGGEPSKLASASSHLNNYYYAALRDGSKQTFMVLICEPLTLTNCLTFSSTPTRDSNFGKC